MKQLSRYAYANTRIKVRISGLLDEGFFTRAVSVDFAGFIEMLGKTGYAEIFKPGEHIKPEDFENRLRDKDREIIKKIARFYSSRNEKNLILLLDERYKVEELKTALRIWKRRIKGEDIEIPGVFSSLSSAETIDDVVKILEGSGYSDAVEKAREDYLKTGSLFPVEVRIDTEYFEKLNKHIEKLSRFDRDIAKKIIGAEIDRENLLWLGRIHLYYQGKVPSDVSGFIPGGSYIPVEELKRASLNVSESIQRMKIPQVYRRVIGLVPNNLAEMDRLLEAIILQLIKRAFIEKPFSIGIPIGYIFLKLTETKRITEIFTMKYFTTVVYQ